MYWRHDTTVTITLHTHTMANAFGRARCRRAARPGHVASRSSACTSLRSSASSSSDSTGGTRWSRSALYYVRMFVRDRRLPPLLLAPRLQDQPLVPVRARLPRRELGAEGRAVVGGASSRPSQVLRPAARTSTRRAQKGLWWSHVGWILCAQVRRDQVRAHQGLRAVSRAALAQQVAPGAAGAAGRWCWRSSVARRCWSGASSSRRCSCGTAPSPSTRCRTCSARCATRPSDDSKNNWLLALITIGEGWHNNHHYYQSTANQGFFWWEIDTSYYTLKALSWLGLVWDLRTPPRHIRDSHKSAATAPLPSQPLSASEAVPPRVAARPLD